MSPYGAHIHFVRECICLYIWYYPVILIDASTVSESALDGQSEWHRVLLFRRLMIRDVLCLSLRDMTAEDRKGRVGGRRWTRGEGWVSELLVCVCVCVCVCVFVCRQM